MKKITLILFTVLSLMPGCTRESGFTEKIIDADAPKNLWMKTTGDINGDGRTDILAGGWVDGGIVMYLAPGWEKQVLCDTLKVSTDAEVCDIDNNGTPDLVVIVRSALVWLNGPDWGLHIIDSVTLHDIEVKDFDNDGLADIVGRNQAEWGQGDTLYFFHRKISGEWETLRKTIVNGEGLKAADINGDNRQDIVINGYWLENTGDIHNWPEHRFSDTWSWRNTFIDVADINNDGWNDILVSPSELAGHKYHVSWFQRPEDPSGVWQEHIVIDTIETVIHFIGAADFNLDGKMDFILAHMQQGADPDEVAVFCQEHGSRWRKQVISTGGSHSMRLGDFDGDGDIDVFGGNWEEHVVKMWINDKL
jgi:FG-GAP-like repeat